MKKIIVTKIEGEKYRVRVTDSETNTDFEITFNTLMGVMTYVVLELASE